MNAERLAWSLSEYHADGRNTVSHSELDCFIASPKLYYGRYIADPPLFPRDESPALLFGGLFHELLLENRREWAVWNGGRRYGKEWDAFNNAALGRVLTGEENDSLESMVASIRGHSRASALLDGGEPEVTVRWVDEETGIVCRARLDKLRDNVVVDLKSCRSASPREFSAASYRYGYHRQAAWYSDAVNHLAGEHLPFVFIAVEKEPPYACEVFELDEQFVELGREENRAALRRLAECRRAVNWESPTHGTIVQISAPRWAYSESEWELV